MKPQNSIRRLQLIGPLLLVGGAFLMVPIGTVAAPQHRGGATGTQGDPVADKLDYNRDIRPILAAKCFACHGSDLKSLQAGLRLDLRDIATHKLASGKVAIVPGKPQQSELVQRITLAGGSLQMPPPDSKKTLTAAEKATLQRWIAQGAEYKQHWAFVKPVRPALPPVKLASWPRNPIDRFVLAKLEHEGLTPSPPADRVTLLRRVSLDLTGIPPTPAEVDSFIQDRSPNAYEKVVDRLLASPQYGERMAMTWLDGARYADSNGYQADYERYQWPWRDWVIDAYNRNMPFDQFTIEQIAGDLLPNATRSQRIATGFNRNHRINTEGGVIPEEWRVETVIDRVETTSAVWLGLTTGCARCHDHKYDPITQKEFYQLASYFNNVPESGIGEERPINHPPVLRLPTDEQTRQLAQLGDELKQTEPKLAARLAANADPAARWTLPAPQGAETKEAAAARALLAVPQAQRTEEQKRTVTQLWSAQYDPEYRALAAKRDADVKQRDKVNGEIPSVMVMDEMPKPRECYVLVRGQYDKHGDVVTAGLPAAFPPLPRNAPNNRLGLAQWIAGPDNPLTARVAVNRFWEKFFGVGIVATSEDFGTRAEFPSHPELLDWLGTEFVRLKWDMKALQKEIVLSATYRQPSRITPELLRRDPENRLLARGPRFRLPAELIRDQALAAAGLLTEKIGGPSVRPYQPEGVWDEVSVYGNLHNYQHAKGPDLYRRSLYTIWKRTAAPPFLTLFDVPGRETCRVRRSRTNTPLQALVLENDPTFVEAARVLAQRMLAEGGTTPEARIAWAYRRLLCRRPTPAESRVLAAGVQGRIIKYRANPEAAAKLVSIGDAPRDPKLDVPELAAYTLTASVLLNLDETITKE